MTPLNKETNVINSLRQVSKEIMPKGTHVWLYGSRARGDYAEDSDWDILVLLDKEKVEYEDFGALAFPLETAGWQFNAGISPIIYTKKEWEARSFTPFYHNVMNDRVKIL